MEMMISMNNIDQILKIKLSHDKASNNTRSLNHNTINSQHLEKKSDNSSLIVTHVTICLTVHNECSGKYIDSTGKFIVKCLCQCHNKFFINTTKEVYNKN